MAPTSRELFEEIFDRIIQLLEKGTVPWRKPWNAEWPQNLFTRHRYAGINYFLLTNAGFGSPYWATENQIKKHGGTIKPDQKDKPHHVAFAIPPSQNRVDAGGQVYLDFEGRQGFYLGAHAVFNSEQTEGLDRILGRRFGKPRPPPLEEGERIVGDMPQRPRFEHNPERAYYSPVKDFISVPPRELYSQAEEYYSTLFHELIHSTGHASRLKRQSLMESEQFGDHAYSQEELVAEMGAAMLCGLTGISPKSLENSASYVASWLRVLQSDRRMLIPASYQSQKACNFITGEAIAKNKDTERQA